MDKPQYTSVPRDELKRIEAEVQNAETVDDLRALYGQLQMLRRMYVDDFDIQLAVNQIQQTVLERGGLLHKGKGGGKLNFGPSKAPAPVAPEFDEPPAARQEPPFSAQLPNVQQIDEGSWKRAVYIGAFFAIVLFAGFFYLIQTARRLNMPSEQKQEETDQNQSNGQQKPRPGAGDAQKPAAPTLRLYTDLIPGSVVVDGGAAKDLQDGELQLDSLKPGKHSIKLAGSTGDAAFDFEVPAQGAPKLSGPPTANNALVVTVTTQDGKGELMTNAGESSALIDNKVAGTIPSTGLQLEELGSTDHDLQIKRATDAQRFVLTYIAAPTLTVFVKSDPNAGSLVVLTGEDGADVSIDGQRYRRKTEHGQLRIPTLRAGMHSIGVEKSGFKPTLSQSVTIKKGEEARLEFHLEAVPQTATIQIRNADPGTQVFVDRNFGASVAPDGSANLGGLPPGAHTIEFRREGFTSKSVERSLKAGDTLVLSGADVTLEKPAAASPASGTAQTPTQAPTAPAAPTQTPAETANEPANVEVQPASIPGSVHKGGGFLIYHATKTPGRYVFSLQLRKGGGFLKGKHLQWFAGFQDTKNYTLFQVDGKNFIVRTVVGGKSEEVKKVPFETDFEGYLQIDMSVKPNGADVKMKPNEGNWQNLGNVSTEGVDLTQGKFGVLISGNDEVGVSTIRFGR